MPWPYCSLVVLVDTVQLVGDELEVVEQVVLRAVPGYVIEEPRDVECRCAERGMPGRVCWKRRREILIASRVRARCAQGQPIRIAVVVDGVVANSCWPRGLVVLADTHNRSPKIVYVLLIPRQDASVGHRDVH